MLYDLLNSNKFEEDFNLLQEFSFATGISTHELKQLE